ncbi:MAG: STAS domain-containing protein [Prevotella sp.]|nr:STAS domain-containing protein [Prevotella sp.]
MMKIDITEQDGRLVAALCGDLDNTASREAEKALAPLFERDDCDILIDCSELDYISSSGLRILLNIYKHVRKTGHKALVSHVDEDVEEVLRLGGFLQLFEKED